MTPPLEAPGRWIADRRGGGRGVRVSAHEEAGFLVLSTWKESRCVGTVRLLPDEAADLVAGIAEALGRLASRPPDQAPADRTDGSAPTAAAPPAGRAPQRCR